MSDAGGEYKSDAFLKHFKDAGIKVLQSAPHTPQQNGPAEHFMRTIMDKAQALRLEACCCVSTKCLPDLGGKVPVVTCS